MGDPEAIYKVSDDRGRPKVTVHARALEAAGIEAGEHVIVDAEDGRLTLARLSHDGDIRQIGGTNVVIEGGPLFE